MAHPLAADAAMRHLDAATVANHPLVLHPAVFAAGAFPVFLGPKDPLAEEPVLFGTVRPVVDRLRLLDLAERPATNVVGAGEPNLDGAVVIDTIVGTFAHAHGTRSSARLEGTRRSGVVSGESQFGSSRTDQAVGVLVIDCDSEEDRQGGEVEHRSPRGDSLANLHPRTFRVRSNRRTSRKPTRHSRSTPGLIPLSSELKP